VRRPHSLSQEGEEICKGKTELEENRDGVVCASHHPLEALLLKPPPGMRIEMTALL